MTIKFDTYEARKRAYSVVKDANDIFMGENPEGHLVMATFDVKNDWLYVKSYIDEERGMFRGTAIDSEGSIVYNETAFDLNEEEVD